MEDVQEIPLRERAGEYLMLRLRLTGGCRLASVKSGVRPWCVPLPRLLRLS